MDYNDLYKFNFSIGAEYQNLSPFGDYGTEFNSYYDLSALARLPLPFMPVLQPLAQFGLIQFIAPERDNQDKWTFSMWYAALGAGYYSRFSKNFEIGAEASAGLGEAVFPKLDPAGSRGSTNLMLSAGFRIALNPSYNMSIDIHPGIKYFHSLSPLTRFNGPVLGLGFSGSYRFGDDPDAPQAVIRSIRFSNAAVPPVFAAMQSYYTKNPIGKVTITNTETFTLNDIDITFFQAGYMDSPTKAASIPELKPGESRTVEVFATFNEQVFTTQGILPLTGEFSVSYNARGKPVKQVSSLAYDLYDKNALTWDDDRKVAAFITPADSALRNYASFIRQSVKEEAMPGFSENLQIGMQVFYALKEIGCLYQIDPTSPFTAAQNNTQVVDSISLPRETLKRLTGDCDDLTVLFCSILETVGIETAFITVPGHIFAAFNTKVPSRSYRQVHPDPAMSLNIGGELWIPVEITLIGKEDFLVAWRLGMQEFSALDAKPDERGFYKTAESHKIFRSVGLRETDLGLQYGRKSEIVANFKKGIDKLIDFIIEDYIQAADKSGRKADYNRLGIICAQYGRYAQSQKALNQALSLDRNYVDPVINLGNVYYLKGEFQNALRNFHRAEERFLESRQTESPSYVRLLLNLSKTYYELENFDKSSEYYKKASEIDRALIQQYSYLGSARGAGRAADVSSGPRVLFVEEE